MVEIPRGKFIKDLKLSAHAPTYTHIVIAKGRIIMGISNVSHETAQQEAMGTVLKQRNAFQKD